VCLCGEKKREKIKKKVKIELEKRERKNIEDKRL
jgi:hypothetical protein